MVNIGSENIESKEHLSRDFTQGYPLSVEEMMRIGRVIRKRTVRSVSIGKGRGSS